MSRAAVIKHRDAFLITAITASATRLSSHTICRNSHNSFPSTQLYPAKHSYRRLYFRIALSHDSRTFHTAIRIMAPKTGSQAASSPSSDSISSSSAPSSTQDSSNRSSRSILQIPNNKPTIVILGTGWAGWTLAQDLGTSLLTKTHNIIILSPSRTMALTPLLASAACSIFELRVAEEPVRRLGNKVIKYQVWVDAVDLDNRRIRCRPAVGSNGDARLAKQDSLGGTDENVEGGEGNFEVTYDTLVLAPGCETNTFDTPGVHEWCYKMRSVSDARKLRERILDCFELASLPTFNEQQKKDILHFVIIGGGPTGVELAAEIDDLVNDHLLGVYRDLKGLVTISVYDVADRMLGMFGDKLSEYAMEKFRRRDVKVKMGRKIEGFDRGVMHVKGDGEVGFGVAVWCAGNKAGSLVEGLGCRKSEKGMERILTDSFLRVLQSKPGNESVEEEIIEGVYALGDASDIEGNELPATAEVAVQKAKWLAKHLISIEGNPNCTVSGKGETFKYKQKALVAYIGGQDGIIEGGRDWTGNAAWIAWRSGSLEWTRSWRRRVVICVDWVLNWWDGREIARK